MSERAEPTRRMISKPLKQAKEYLPATWRVH